VSIKPAILYFSNISKKVFPSTYRVWLQKLFFPRPPVQVLDNVEIFFVFDI